MARLRKRTAPDEDESPGYRSTALGITPTRISSEEPSQTSSPSASFSSDKENHAYSTRNSREKSRMSTATSTSTSRPQSPGANKRIRLGEPDLTQASNIQASKNSHSILDTSVFDPDQPVEERRKNRKAFRDLARDLADSRNEFMAANSTGIAETISKANSLLTNVKQTTDATLDSRLLVKAGDLTARRAVQNKFAGATRGIDLDEFVTKCIGFMNRGPTEAQTAIAEVAIVPTSTQSRRRRVQDGDDSDEERLNDDGDELNWPWLGLKVFPTNLRPPCPNWMLGPLSVQKRARKVMERRERMKRRDPADAVRPDELKANEIQRQENSNLTSLCRKIYALLQDFIGEQAGKIQEDHPDFEDLTDEEQYNILTKYRITDAGGVNLYHFAFNPKSFGQTVENFFYISFLVRDSKASISNDSRGFSSLNVVEASSADQVEADNRGRSQAVIHLDFDIWRDVIEAFDIRASIIPHREDDGGQEVGARGWYS